MRKNKKAYLTSLTACAAAASMTFSQISGTGVIAGEADRGQIVSEDGAEQTVLEEDGVQIVSENTASADGAGSDAVQEDPAGSFSITQTVQISTAEELKQLAERCSVDERSRGLMVLLTDDIDLGGVEFSSIPVFLGVFDGQGHTVSGLKITRDTSVCGFFRYAGEGSVISNLRVEGRLDPGAQAQIVGGIAGDNRGTIRNCSFKGSSLASQAAGGICGVNHKTGLISGCSFEGYAGALHQAGGIAGSNEGIVISCISKGEVNTRYMETDSEMKNNFLQELTNLSSFDVSEVNREDFVDLMDIGGIAGISTGQIIECVNDGDVGYSRTGYNVGGIAGRSSGFTLSCTNNGGVRGRKDVGGIIGQLEPESVWEYSREKLELLKSELVELDKRIDTLVLDLSGDASDTKETVRAASGYAKQTIAELENVTDEASESLKDAWRQADELIAQLESAYHKENAQAMNDALKQLAQLISRSEGLELPVTAEITSTLSTNFDEVLDEREKRFWTKLREYLASHEKNVPVSETSYPETSREMPLSEAQEDDPAREDFSQDMDLSQSGLIEDGSVTDIPIQGTGTTEEGTTSDPNDFYPTDTILDADDQSGTIFEGSDQSGSIFEESALSDPIVTDSGNDFVIPEENSLQAQASQDVIVQEASVQDDIPLMTSEERENLDQALIVSEESVMTGEGDVLSASAVFSGDEEDGEVNPSVNVDVDVDSNLAQASGLPDAAALRSLINEILTNASSLLDPEALEGAGEILRSIKIGIPDTKAFYAAFQNLTGSLPSITDSITNMTKDAAKDVDSITDQMDKIISTFFDVTENISLEDRYTKEDVSRIDPYRSDSSSIEKCNNNGSIEGDTNTGGVTGCVGMESKIDAEDTLNISRYLLREARYTVFASVRECRNTGETLAKKEGAGGIAGRMDFGVVTDSINSGPVSVEEGDYGGGICGKSQGVIMNSCAGSMVSGNAYLGGIAGEADSILSCVSYSYVRSSGAYAGAIAGWAQGDVSGCRYVDYGLGGIDGIGYAGIAEPADPQAISSGEATPDLINTCTITFEVDGEVFAEKEVPLGGRIDHLPEVPNKGEDYWKWDDFDQDPVFVSMTVSGSWKRPVTTLASGGEVPEYLVEGVFYEGQSLSVEDYTPSNNPVTASTIIEAVEGKISRKFADGKDPAQTEPAQTASLKVTGTENDKAAESDAKSTDPEQGSGTADDPENGNTKAVHAVKEMLANRLSGRVIDAKTLRVNDYEGGLKVRMRAAEGGKLFLASGDGTLRETEYEKDGSYIVFSMDNGSSFVYYESIRQNKDMRIAIAAGAAASAAAAAGFLFILFLIRKKRKQRRLNKK